MIPCRKFCWKAECGFRVATVSVVNKKEEGEPQRFPPPPKPPKQQVKRVAPNPTPTKQQVTKLLISSVSRTGISIPVFG